MSEWDTDARWCDVRASVDTLPSAGQTLQLRSREIAFSQAHSTRTIRYSNFQTKVPPLRELGETGARPKARRHANLQQG